ncbi:MAG: 4Fe-4S dicluster domain-containing protein [Candidatus Nezhaarchaeales archaeon]
MASPPLLDLMTNRGPEADARERLRRVLGSHDPHACYACARCTSGCEAMELLENFPHKVVGLAKLGFLSELVSSEKIWACMQCLKCTERCPQDVAPSDVFLVLRNLAVKEGAKVPEGFFKALEMIMENGYIQPVQEVVARTFETFDRKSLGLRERPPGPADGEKFREALTASLEGVL